MDLLPQLGVLNIKRNNFGVVTGEVPSNLNSGHPNEPVIGFLSHLDTSPDAPNAGVKPRIHKVYQRGHIQLEGGTMIHSKYLKAFKGQDLITSDGTTLLGADDKAGIAEILELLAVLKTNPQLKHPGIRVAFTPDEEIAGFINEFDIKGFGATAAYTVDSDAPTTLEKESFNAHSVKINIKGRPVHPGYGKKGGLINPILLAHEIIASLPKKARPETTDGKQGYYFVHEIKGGAEDAELGILVRDFSMARSKQRIARIQRAVEVLRKRYPKAKLDVTVKFQYGNMADVINKHPEVVAHAKAGIERTGLTPKQKPIRGGTDGSTLSLLGLPTPNIGGGGQLFHSKREFVSVQAMRDSVRVMLNLLASWSDNILAKQPD